MKKCVNCAYLEVRKVGFRVIVSKNRVEVNPKIFFRVSLLMFFLLLDFARKIRFTF